MNISSIYSYLYVCIFLILRDSANGLRCVLTVQVYSDSFP